MKHKMILLLSLIIICTLLGAELSAIKPVRGDTTHGSASSEILLGMLGEIRYTFAAFIWLKADYYHHEYELNKKDWRRNRELMALIQLVTILDPHFIQAYDFGAYHLAVNLKKFDEAYKFLQQGLINNPESFELNWEKGYLLCTEKRYREALPYLLIALKECNKKSYMDQSVDKKVWVLSRLSSCYIELKEWDEAAKYINMWIKLNPDSQLPRKKLEYIEKQRKRSM